MRARSAASAKATTWTQAAASSAATWKLSGPFPATSTREPGATRYERSRIWAAPVVITPCWAQPAKGAGPFEGPRGQNQRPAPEHEAALPRGGVQFAPARTAPDPNPRRPRYWPAGAP